MIHHFNLESEIIMNNQDVKVSVICTAYNHERYIRQCLDGFLMQKTTFPFEVIIHDDASIDKTAEIIKEYQDKYPDIIKPVYQSENQYQRQIPIVRLFMLPLATGKYAALCEGDDYWTDPYKLQRQYECMEAHPECAMCVCKVRGVSEDTKDTLEFFPKNELSDGVISSEEFITLVAEQYPFQTSSYFFKMDEYRRYHSDEVTFYNGVPIGDVPMMLYFGQLGPVFYCNTEMSHYRMNSSSSIVRRQQLSTRAVQVSESMVNMIDRYNQFTDCKYADILDKCRKRYEIRKLYNEGKYLQILIRNRDWMKVLERKQRVDLILNAFFPHLYPKWYSLYLKTIKQWVKS